MKRYKIHTGENSKGLLKVSLVAEPAIKSKLMYFTEENDLIFFKSMTEHHKMGIEMAKTFSGKVSLKMQKIIDNIIKNQNAEIIEMNKIANNETYNFTEENRNFVFTDEEKRIIYAPALIPDLDIYRKDVNGEPANVFFDKETILKLHLDGCRNGYDSKINLNHSESEDIQGVYCFENWIVGEDNRAEKFGFEVPEGTLMKGYKVDNEELWQDIKNGKVTGLSIEASLMPIEEEEKQPINKFNMNKKSIMALAIEEIKKLFKFADATDYGGGYFGSSLDLGSIITDKDGNPMPNTSFTYEDKVYETDDMGAIVGVEDVKAEAKEVELEAATVAPDERDAKITDLETQIADLKAQLASKDEMKMSSETELLKLKEDLIEAKKVKAIAVPQKKYDEMSNFEKMKYNKEK